MLNQRNLPTNNLIITISGSTSRAQKYKNKWKIENLANISYCESFENPNEIEYKQNCDSGIQKVVNRELRVFGTHYNGKQK